MILQWQSLPELHTKAVARTQCPQRQQMYSCIAVPYTGGQQLQMNTQVCTTQVQYRNLCRIKEKNLFFRVSRSYKPDNYILHTPDVINYLCFSTSLVR